MKSPDIFSRRDIGRGDFFTFCNAYGEFIDYTIAVARGVFAFAAAEIRPETKHFLTAAANYGGLVIFSTAR